MRSPRCVFGHRWEPHPAFAGMPVRRCGRCARVESSAFACGSWRRVEHLDGLSERECRVLMWHRRLARELNEQFMRRGDPRAIW